MDKNTPKFLIAESPMDNVEFEQFIYSSFKENRALIKVDSVNISSLFELLNVKNIHPVFFVSKSTGLPEFYILSIEDNIDIANENICSVLLDAAKWYKNFLIWEEKETFEGNAKQQLLKDYNKNVKGLKILADQAENMYLFIFRGRVKVFDSDVSGFNWLTNEFNIDKKDISKGQYEIVEEIEDKIVEELENSLNY